MTGLLNIVIGGTLVLGLFTVLDPGVLYRVLNHALDSGKHNKKLLQQYL